MLHYATIHQSKINARKDDESHGGSDSILHFIHMLEYHARFLPLAVVTWEVGLTLNLRNCLPMCGSDPESFYPRAYDLYDPLECGPLDR